MTQAHCCRQRNSVTVVNDRPRAEQVWINMTKHCPWPHLWAWYLTGHPEASALLQAQHCF